MAREPRRARGGGFAATVTSGLVVCLAAAAALLAHIRLKDELNRLYGDIGRLDRQLAELRRANHKLEIDFEILTSPAGLSARLRDLRLSLIMPGNDARFVLPEPSFEPDPSGPVFAPGPGEDRRLALTGATPARTPPRP